MISKAEVQIAKQFFQGIVSGLTVEIAEGKMFSLKNEDGDEKHYSLKKADNSIEFEVFNESSEVTSLTKIINNRIFQASLKQFNTQNTSSKLSVDSTDGNRTTDPQLLKANKDAKETLAKLEAVFRCCDQMVDDARNEVTKELTTISEHAEIIKETLSNVNQLIKEYGVNMTGEEKSAIDAMNSEQLSFKQAIEVASIIALSAKTKSAKIASDHANDHS